MFGYCELKQGISLENYFNSDLMINGIKMKDDLIDGITLIMLMTTA